MNRILVIGGTGNVGRQVLAQLPATGVPVRALARNPHTAGLPPHVDVVRGGLTRPESLDECLDGVDAVFLVWFAPPDAAVPALERILKHARRIVFLSSPHKTPHPFFQGGQPNPVAALQTEIERLIEASGRQWTFLRPGMFAANAHRPSDMASRTRESQIRTGSRAIVDRSPKRPALRSYWDVGIAE